MRNRLANPDSVQTPSAARGRERIVLLALCAVALLGAGCKVGPNFVPPVPRIAPAGSWRTEGSEKLIGQPSSEPDWWKTFGDPKLDALVAEAFANNLELQDAALRIVQARLGRSASGALLFPAATGSAGWAHSFFSRTVKPNVDVSLPDVHANVPPLLSNLPPLLDVSGKPSVAITPEIDIYTAGFDAFWELDVWGEKRRGFEAASGELAAAYADYEAAAVSLVGEVAAVYIGIRTIEARLATLQRNIGAMRTFQKIASDRVAAGESPETDLHLATTLLATVEAGAPALRDARRRSVNALAALLGRPPGDLAALIGFEGPIPSVPAEIALGIPGDLLRRRPDIRRAEELAHAQCARIGKAKAALLPSFKLAGALGLQTSDFDNFFRGESVSALYGGGVSINGLLLYPVTVLKVRAEDAQYEQALLGYQQAVLDAARETEDAISRFIASEETLPILNEGAVAARRSSELAVEAYGAGKVIVSVPLVALTFQSSLDDRELAARGESATNAVAIYKALGGGWESRFGEELIPEEMRERMKNRSDWGSFTGKIDLRTTRPAPKP